MQVTLTVTPHFYIKPHFLGLSPLSSNIFGTPPSSEGKMQGPTPPFNKVVVAVGGPTMY